MRCNHCGRDSDPLFKFCLHCGRELVDRKEEPKKGKVAATPKTPEPEVVVPEPEPQLEAEILEDTPVGLAETYVEAPKEQEIEPEPEPEPEPELEVQPEPEPEVFVQPEPVPEPEPPLAQADGQAEPAPAGFRRATDQPAMDKVEVSPVELPRCPLCRAEQIHGQEVCHLCGFKFDAPVEAPRGGQRPTSGADRGPVTFHLVSIDTSTGMESSRMSLPDGNFTLGRTGSDLQFGDDSHLSPHHLDISLKGGRAVISCPGSLNGTFVRIESQVALEHEDLFRIGQQLLKFEEMRFVTPIIPAPQDGTAVMGSPTPSVVWARLSQLVSSELLGSSFLLTGEKVFLGREKGNITFPGDRYMSASHATITRRSDGYFLKDLGSSNGTFLKLKGSMTLGPGQFFLAGKQLFRFEKA